MAYSILSNTFIASTGRAVNVVLGLLITIIVTRYLGPEKFGTYSFLLAYGALLHILADFGLYLTLTRDISRHPDKEIFFISHTVTMRLALVTAVFLLGILAAIMIPAMRPLWILLAVASFGYAAQSMSQLMMGIYQKYGLMWRVALGDLAGRLVQFFAILVFLRWIIDGLGYAEDFALMAVVAAFSLGAVASYFLHRLFLPIKNKFPLAFDWSVWKDITKRTWPLGVMLLVNAVYFRIDILVLSFFREAGEVGFYGLAYKVVESGLFFPAMFGGLVLPRLSRMLSEKKNSQVKNLIKECLHFLLTAGMLALVLLVFFATPLLVWLSGEDYSAAGPILQILSAALFVMFFGNLFGFALVSLEKQKALLVLYLCLAAFNLAANIIFIPRYGAIAAAWTTVATEFLAAGVSGWMVLKMVRFRVDAGYIGKVALIAAGTGMFAAVLPETWHVASRVFLAAGVYGLLAALLGLVRKDKLKLLLSSGDIEAKVPAIKRLD